MTMIDTEYRRPPCAPAKLVRKVDAYLLDEDLTGFSCQMLHLDPGVRSNPADFPLAFGTMASLVRINNGHVDIRTVARPFHAKQFIREYDLTCLFPMSAFIQDQLELARMIKSADPGTSICLLNSEQHQHEMPLNAPRAEAYGRSLMVAHPCLDFVLLGEAEYAFLMLCRQLQTGTRAYFDIPACLYRQNGSIQLSHEPMRPVDFNHLPPPARDHLEQTLGEDGINTTSARVQSSRGCLSRCLYCVESAANTPAGPKGGIWKGKSISRFVDEIEDLAHTHGVFFFNIIDSSFEDPGRKGLARIEQFCGEIAKRDLQASFKAHFRIESFAAMDDAFLAMMKAAGIDILILGAESGVERELKSYRKRTTVQKTVETVKRLDACGRFFVFVGHMMLGPYHELGDLEAKVGMLNRIGRAWDFLNMSNNLLVFRGTAYHDFIEANGLALAASPPSTVIPYSYLDPRVGLVAGEMGGLKERCPAAIELNRLFYDALNIASRFQNNANRVLWPHRDLYLAFKQGLETELKTAGQIYSAYFLELVDLAADGWEAGKAQRCFERQISRSIAACRDSMRACLSGFLEGLRADGLSTSRLYLKTWMSQINKKTNTSGGRVQAA